MLDLNLNDANSNVLTQNHDLSMISNKFPQTSWNQIWTVQATTHCPVTTQKMRSPHPSITCSLSVLKWKVKVTW